jgi:hypothetical protein
MSSDLAIASRVEERQLRPWIVVVMHRSMLSQEEGNVPGYVQMDRTQLISMRDMHKQRTWICPF